MPEIRDPRLRRECCRIHAERRAQERHCPVPVSRLERLCRRMQPAFLKPDTTRYVLTVTGGGLAAPDRLGPRAPVRRHGVSGRIARMSARLHLLRPYTGWDVEEYTRDAAAAYVATLRRERGDFDFGTLTRRAPAVRGVELLGGSVYFCKGGVTMFRMPFRKLDRRALGCWILMAPEIYFVASRHVGMVRGWRYLQPDDAPPDLDGVDRAAPRAKLPEGLRATGLV